MGVYIGWGPSSKGRETTPLSCPGSVAELAEDNTDDALRVLGEWLSEGDDL